MRPSAALLILLASPCVALVARVAAPSARTSGISALATDLSPPLAEAEAPLTTPQRVKRALTFWSRVVPILGAYKVADVLVDKVGAEEAAATLARFGVPQLTRGSARGASDGGAADAAAAATLAAPAAEGETRARLYEGIHEWGSTRLEETIQELKGFYVKTGQVISTRVDLFPEQYTTKLASLQDAIEPLPSAVIRQVVEEELLLGEPIDSIFQEFDDEPLGSASIAQVHRAVLLDGREVAVKVQRPNCEPKLQGDITNLKSFSKKLRGALPIDYYTVFCELERVLQGELDFLQEAQSALKVHASVSHHADGSAAPAAVSVPLPVPGLSSRRVLVMDYVKGVPLNKLAETLAARGIEPGSPESKVAGRRILSQLSEAFGRMMLGAGFIHGDPHPGNIFVKEGAEVALIDCGQVKQISTAYRLQLAEALQLVDTWQRDGGSTELIGRAQEKMAQFGVTFLPDAPPEAAMALALLLFGDPEAKMPGNFSSAELSDESPIRAIAAFPQELVLLGRATILIKGIAKRLGVRWSLAEKWRPLAEQALACGVDGCLMPTWSNPTPATRATESAGGSIRFRSVLRSFGASGGMLGEWGKAKVGKYTPKRVKRLGAKVAAKFI